MATSIGRKAKEEIFLTLAEFFKQPTEELFEEIKSGNMDNKLKKVCETAGYAYSIALSKNCYSTYPRMKQEYIDYFTGIVEPYALPIESTYKIWTTDPSAEVTHANSKGYLLGDSALHMRYLLDQFKLEIPNEYKNMPDHLTLLLEFLAFLITEGSDEQVIQFVQDHFNWLDDFKKKLKEVAKSSFYLDVTNLLIQSLEDETNAIRTDANKK